MASQLKAPEKEIIGVEESGHEPQEKNRRNLAAV